MSYDQKEMATENEVRLIWKMTDAVCFDVDSTVIKEEALDELAKFCGKGEEVKKLTLEAMNGNMSFRESFSTRLQIIHPRMSQIKDFIKTSPPRLTPGIKKLVEVLHQRSVPVYLISGGLRSIITPIALELNIPLQNIFANRLKFYFNGEYAGFDDTAPTSRNGGKGEVVKMLKENYGYTNVVLIGDGATDMEASPPAEAFIGYGGNIVREEVKSHSKWYITDFHELIAAL